MGGTDAPQRFKHQFRPARGLQIDVCERLGDGRHVIVFGKSKQPVPVLEPSQRDVEKADLVKDPPVDHEGGARRDRAAITGFAAGTARVRDRWGRSHSPHACAGNSRRCRP